MWGRTASHSAKGGICSKCMFLSCSHPSFTWSVLLPQIGLECCPRLVVATWTESGRKNSKEDGKVVDCNRNAYVAPETYIRMCGQAWNGEETNAWETVMWWERKSCIILYHTITTKLERGTRARTKYRRLPFLTKIMSLKSSPMLYFFKWGMKILLKKGKVWILLFQTKLILTTDECLGYHMLDSVNFDTLVWFLPIFKWSWDQINLFYNLKAIFTLRRASLWFFSFTSLQSKSKLQLTAKGNCFLHFLFVWKRLGKRSEERLWLKRRKKKKESYCF